jgi:UDP-N-acetylmuramate--alanine ligase
MQKFRVGVLMGGKSIEKEVSFNSGRTVCDHLDTSLYNVIPIFQTVDGTLYLLPQQFLHRGKISDFEHRLTTQHTTIAWDDLPTLIDFMYICTHGNFAEDGTLQGFLEVLGIPYLGSKVLASALGMNKLMQKDFLRAHDINVPRGIALTPHETKTQSIDTIIKTLEQHNLDFPYVIKPFKEGSSLGVSVVFNKAELEAAIANACYADARKAQTVLIEEKIEGMEFSCISIKDHTYTQWLPLPPTEIVPEHATHFFDYEQKYMPGRAHKFTPARVSTAVLTTIQETCIKTSQVLGFSTMSRIDGFVDTAGRIIIVDPNSLSGMGPASFIFREAAEINMSHTQLINHLIATELHTYGIDRTMTQTHANKSHVVQKLRIAVLMGGASNEREISLESGRNIFYKLSPHTYAAIPLFVDSKMQLHQLNQSLLVRNSTYEIESILTPDMHVRWQDLPTIADFVFIGLHGGSGENGAVQGTLEMLGLPYNGSGVLTSALAMDKYKTNQFLRSHGFEVPTAHLVAKTMWHTNKTEVLQQIIDAIALPCIVKPYDDGCSVMVAKIDTLEALSTHIELILAHKDAALVEELITGMELTVGVLGNEDVHALPPSQAVAQAGILSIQEKFLPGAGENQTPAPLPPDTLRLVQAVIAHAYKTLQCKGYARIDCFYQRADESPTQHERVVILEVNTLPGMTPATCIFHQAAEIGMKPMEFIDAIIELGLEEHGRAAARKVSQTELEA